MGIMPREQCNLQLQQVFVLGTDIESKYLRLYQFSGLTSNYHFCLNKDDRLHSQLVLSGCEDFQTIV